MQVDLLIHSAGQLVTCASPNGPKRGLAMRDVGLIPDGAVAVADGFIVDAGPTLELRAQYTAAHEVDAGGRVVCPGFVDPHTHIVYAGDRVDEFEQRLAGRSYLDILAAGGGILSTVQKTRAASVNQLVMEASARLDAALKLGTTTVEIKTGYGLDTATELKMLEVIGRLDTSHVVDLVPTFLGAHAVPLEYRDRPDDYVARVVEEMLPAAAGWYSRSDFARRGIPLAADVFCEQGAFSLDQARLILGAARELGLAARAHVDEFVNLGGVGLAAEMGALTADHLDHSTTDDYQILAGSDTTAVILPAVNFHLGSGHYADGRGLIDAGAAVALATDLNPGSAPCPSMPMVMALACRYQGLLPAEALNAATINAAYAAGLGKHVGSIEAGKQADLLVLEATDYRHLAYQFGGNLVKQVIKKGRLL